MSWSMVKNFDHDHGQNSAFNHGQMVKISTMTTAKIQIFHGQNGQPKTLPRNLAKNTNFDHGHERNTNFLWSKWQTVDLTTKFDHIITILTIDHGADSRMSVTMVKFFDH